MTTVKMILPFTDPLAPVVPVALDGRQAAWRAIPDKPVIGLIDNGKLNADKLLRAVGEALVARGAASSYICYRKPSLMPIDGEALSELISEADIVLSAIGDCGGCTASSTTDALRCCEQGVPSFVLATDKFSFLVEATDNSYPIDGLNKLYVDHPIWKRDDAWMRETGERLADQVLSVIGRKSPVREDEAATKIAATADLNEASVNAVLLPLKEGMDSDGYDMDVAIQSNSLKIHVSRREGAGTTCLMPEDAFRKYVASALDDARVPIAPEQIQVTYPALTAA